jgi:hypothetical protein
MDVISFLFVLLVPQGAVIPAGTHVDARLEAAVNTQSASVGDSVVAVLTKPVLAANNRVIPAGSRLRGRVRMGGCCRPGLQTRSRHGNRTEPGVTLCSWALERLQELLSEVVLHVPRVFSAEP